DVGLFIAKTELGKVHFADYWNSQKETLEQKRAEVDTVCRHNYQLYKPYTIDRKSQPNVKIVNRKTLDLEHENLITCLVDGFFPPMIKVTWLKNGIEEGEQVTSSELLQNGDWTFEIHVMLETTIKHGDTFTCRVEHSSLQQPVSVNWEPDVSDSARNKMLTGIVGFVLGSIFIVVGLVVYLRSKKTMTRFSMVQNETILLPAKQPLLPPVVTPLLWQLRVRISGCRSCCEIATGPQMECKAGVENSKGDVKAKIKSNTNLYTVNNCSTGKKTKLLEFCMAGKGTVPLLTAQPAVPHLYWKVPLFSALNSQKKKKSFSLNWLLAESTEQLTVPVSMGLRYCACAPRTSPSDVNKQMNTLTHPNLDSVKVSGGFLERLGPGSVMVCVCDSWVQQAPTSGGFAELEQQPQTSEAPVCDAPICSSSGSLSAD
ncbi:hypothetical protein XELAEV_18039143mg, partial [Xenopus laevis]